MTTPTHPKPRSQGGNPASGGHPGAGEEPMRPTMPVIAGRKASGEKREAIVAAALELFVERGFYGTAVP